MKGLIFALCLLCTGLDVPAQGVSGGVDANHGEACIALGVFATARGASWFEQALVARSILNAATDQGGDACLVAETLPALSRWAFPRNPEALDPIAWRTALDVAHSVASGDYYIPQPCDQVIGVVGADRFIPDGTAPVCVVGSTVFVAPIATPLGGDLVP